MAQVIGLVKTLQNGAFFAKDAQGAIRELKAGDQIFQNELIYGAPNNPQNAQVIIDVTFNSANDITLTGSMELYVDLSVIEGGFQKEEAIVSKEGADNAWQVTTAANPDQALDPTAAGLEETAAGEGLADTERAGGPLFDARTGGIGNVSTDLRNTLNGTINPDLTGEDTSDLNDRPVVADVTETVIEARGPSETGELTEFSGQLVASDPDVGDTHTFFLVEDSLRINGETVPEGIEFELLPDGSYFVRGDFNYLAVGETAKITFDYYAVDNGIDIGEPHDSLPATVTITVNGTNDQPVISDINVNGGSDKVVVEEFSAFGPESGITIQVNGNDVTTSNQNGYYYSTGYDGMYGASSYALEINSATADAVITFPYEVKSFSFRAGAVNGSNENIKVLYTDGSTEIIHIADNVNSSSNYDGYEYTTLISATAPTEKMISGFVILDGTDYWLLDGITFNGSSRVYETHDSSEGSTHTNDVLTTFEGSLAVASNLSDDDTTDTHTFKINGTPSVNNELVTDLGVVVNEDGSYTVTGNFNALAAGETATVTFQYIADDGHGFNGTDGINESSISEPKTVTLKITGTNDQPVVSDVNANGNGIDGEVTYTNEIDSPIYDRSVLSSTLEVTDSGVIQDLNVRINLWHSWDNDLNVGLIAPDGTYISLAYHRGGSGDGYTNTVFDDEASTFIGSGAAPFIGTFIPESSLSALDGKEMEGIWTLRISDEVGADSGTLYSWSLIIDSDGGQKVYESMSEASPASTDILTTFEGSLAVASNLSDDDTTDTHTFKINGTPSVNNELVTDLGVVVNEDGSYTVTGNFNALAAGETATVTFQYIADDGHGFNGTDGINESSISEPKTVTLKITGTNDQPVVSDIDDFTATEALGSGNTTISGALATYSALLDDDTNDAGKHLYEINAGTISSSNNSLSISSITLTNATTGAFDIVGDFNALGEGKTAEITFQYRVNDTSTPSSNNESNYSEYKTVTIAVTGTNDEVLITGATSAGSVTEDDSTLTQAIGSVAFTDFDLTDDHTVTSAPKSTDYSITMGTFVAVEKTDTTGSGTGGVVDWTYTINNAAAQQLAAGQKVTEVYTITINDNNGDTVTQDVTITIIGTNDAPVIEAAGLKVDYQESFENLITTPDSWTVIADPTFTGDHGMEWTTAGGNQGLEVQNGNVGGSLASDGSVHAELDSHHIVTLSTVIKVTDDTTILSFDYKARPGVADSDMLVRFGSIEFTVKVDGTVVGIDPSIVAITSSTVAGQTPWYHVVLTASALVAGDTTLTFEGLGKDDSLGAYLDNVKVYSDNIAGTVHELVNTSGSEFLHVTSGVLAFDDVDLTDGHTVSANKPDGYLGTFTPSISDSATGAGNGAITWKFEVADSALDHLKEGETLQQTYTITVDDGHGGTDTQDITVTLVGKNDAPVAVDDAITTNEDTIFTSTIDLDANDTDLDVDALSVVAGTFTTEQGGTIVLASDGSYTYTPAKNFSGVDTVNYTVTDGQATDIGKLTINVTPVADAPSLIMSLQQVESDSAPTFSIYAYNGQSSYVPTGGVTKASTADDVFVEGKGYGVQKNSDDASINKNQALMFDFGKEISNASFNLTFDSGYETTGQWTAYDENGEFVRSGDITNTSSSISITGFDFQYIAFDATKTGSTNDGYYINPVAATQNTNYIINGSFEDVTGIFVNGTTATISYDIANNGHVKTREIPGWKVEGGPASGTGKDTNGYVNYMEPHDGKHADVGVTDGQNYMDLGASPGNTAIYQTISGLTSGKSYALSFDYFDKALKQSLGQDSGKLEVYWNDKLIDTINGDNTDAYRSWSATVVAEGTNELLFKEIGTAADNGGMAIDNVQLVNATTFAYELDIVAQVTDDTETLSGVTLALPTGFPADAQFYQGTTLLTADTDGKYTIDLGEDNKEVIRIETQNELSVEQINGIEGNVTSSDSLSSTATTVEHTIANVDVAGNDILVLPSGGDIDFSVLNSTNNPFDSVEVIDLSIAGENALTNLSLQDVVDMTDNAHDLYILGSSNDSVDFSNSGSIGWAKAASTVTETINGASHTFDVYTNASDPTVVVKVEQNIIDTI